ASLIGLSSSSLITPVRSGLPPLIFSALNPFACPNHSRFITNTEATASIPAHLLHFIACSFQKPVNLDVSFSRRHSLKAAAEAQLPEFSLGTEACRPHAAVKPHLPEGESTIAQPFKAG